MSEYNRRNKVKVHGWLWLTLGTLVFLSGVLNLMAYSAGNDQDKAHQSALITSLGTVILFVFSLTTLISAANFLLLKSWARVVLIWMARVVCLYIVLFFCYFLSVWLDFASKAPLVMNLVLPVACLLISCLFIAPFIIAHKYLKSEEVRSLVTR